MFDDHESKRCVKDPTSSLKAFLANLHVTPDLAAHKAQSPHGRKSSCPWAWARQARELLVLSPLFCPCSLSVSTHWHAHKHLRSLQLHGTELAGAFRHSPCGQPLVPRLPAPPMLSHWAPDPSFDYSCTTQPLEVNPPCSKPLYSQFQLMAAQPHNRDVPS